MPEEEQKHTEVNNPSKNIDQEDDEELLDQTIIECAHCTDLLFLPYDTVFECHTCGGAVCHECDEMHIDNDRQLSKCSRISAAKQ